MNAAFGLLLVASFSGAPVTLTTLDGQSVNGELLTLSTRSVQLQTDAEEPTFPVEQLMLLDFQGTNSAEGPPPRAVLLNDQSLIGFESLSLVEKNLKIQTLAYNEQLIPVNEIQNIRWGTVDAKVTESWLDLQTRGARDDLLVFRKGDLLDYVAGTVNQIGENGVTVNVRGRDLTAPLERVFAVVFANRTIRENPGIGLVRTSQGDELKAKSLALAEDKVAVSLMSGLDLSVDLSKISEIDFGGGRIRFLADLPFDDSASVAPDEDFPVVWFTARNFPAGSGGRRALLIGGEQYQRGLWLHSGAVVRFRLNRQFSEFRTLAGFDQTHIGKMPRFNPKVKFIIEGDGVELFAQEFNWDTSPVKVNLNLSSVRELVIRVESRGVGKGILEHFALGDAQVIK